MATCGLGYNFQGHYYTEIPKCCILNNLDGNKGDGFWETLKNSKSDSHEDGNA